jgi:hypothetical protein
MELLILIPTLAVSILFSLAVLLYSLSKVAGNLFSFKRAATQPVAADDSVSVPSTSSGEHRNSHRLQKGGTGVRGNSAVLRTESVAAHSGLFS